MSYESPDVVPFKDVERAIARYIRKSNRQYQPWLWLPWATAVWVLGFGIVIGWPWQVYAVTVGASIAVWGIVQIRFCWWSFWKKRGRHMTCSKWKWSEGKTDILDGVQYDDNFDIEWGDGGVKTMIFEQLVENRQLAEA